jgi:hypothetical protein
MRDELWDAYKDWLGTGNVDPKLKDDTCGIQNLFVSSGKLQIESKDHMKERGLSSPDLADAACLTFFAPNNVKQEDEFTKKKSSLPRYLQGVR